MDVRMGSSYSSANRSIIGAGFGWRLASCFQISHVLLERLHASITTSGGVQPVSGYVPPAPFRELRSARPKLGWWKTIIPDEHPALDRHSGACEAAGHDTEKFN